MNDGIYLCYNAMAIYMYVGRYVDPWYINEIFKVEDIKRLSFFTRVAVGDGDTGANWALDTSCLLPHVLMTDMCS